MSGRDVVLGQIADREIALCWQDRRLVDLFIEGEAPAIGSLYRVKVHRALKGQGAYLVDTPDGPGWLKDKSGLRPGDHVLAQMASHPGPNKALPLTRALSFRSRYAVLTPGKPGHNISRSITDPERRAALQPLAEQAGDYGLIMRSACALGTEAAIADDIAALRAAADAVLSDQGRGPELLLPGDGPHERAWVDWWEAATVHRGEDALTHWDVYAEIARLLQPEAALSGGGKLHIEPVTAFVAVDVDTGSDTSPAAGLKANSAMAEALPRQLTLRGLGGQVVVDPAPMSRKERHGFDQRLTRFLRSGPVATDLVGWTPLGHVELSRKRSRVPLAEALAGRDLGATPESGRAIFPISASR